jgi:hypothetical protein
MGNVIQKEGIRRKNTMYLKVLIFVDGERTAYYYKSREAVSPFWSGINFGPSHGCVFLLFFELPDGPQYISTTIAQGARRAPLAFQGDPR